MWLVPILFKKTELKHTHTHTHTRSKHRGKRAFSDHGRTEARREHSGLWPQILRVQSKTHYLIVEVNVDICSQADAWNTLKNKSKPYDLDQACF